MDGMQLEEGEEEENGVGEALKLKKVALFHHSNTIFQK